MTDNETLPAKLREAAKRADYFQTGEQGLLKRAAEVIEAAEKAHPPTGHAKESDTSPERVKNGADSSHVAPTDDERETLEAAIWDVLEPRLEDIIDLDLNVPADNAVFAILVGQVVDAVVGFDRSVVPEPQGEPSDAQVLADEIENYMRRQDWMPASLAIRAVAALRAASAVTEQRGKP